jgi:mevalonate kinase
MGVFRSHGKLLITGEYAVIKGAKSLAVPCKKGQTLNFIPTEDTVVHWQSFDLNGVVWFETKFNVNTFAVVETSNSEIGENLVRLLRAARLFNSDFLTQGGIVKTHLEFDLSWGLGSSSTLVSNIALWANVNPYQLLERCFGGSGYDIACATATKPITYIRNQYLPKVELIQLNYPFQENLFFVHLNKKRNSQKAVATFNFDRLNHTILNQISELTNSILGCTNQNHFNSYLEEHESIVSSLLNEQPVQQALFPDFEGVIKSLGAWGGDFVLASGAQNSPDYFHHKGYQTVIPFKEMILG